MLKLNSNLEALRAINKLATTSTAKASVAERLASGQRINRASDDAAGLAIASTLNANSRIYTQAIRNINDGTSALSIAEGALTSLSGILQRQKELATEAANGTYSTKQRSALQAESDALTNEYNRIVATTSFNGTSLLNGSQSQMRLQVGENGAASSLLSVDFSGLVTTASGSSSATAASGSAERDAFNFGSLQAYEEFIVSLPDGSSINDGDYFTFQLMNSGVQSDYYVWFNVTGSAINPGQAGLGFEVFVNSGDDSTQVTNAVYSELSGNLNTVATFNTAGSNIYFTGVQAGDVATGNSYGSLSVSTISDGYGVAEGDYFLFSTPTANYYAWFRFAGNGANPNIAGRTGIAIDFAYTDNASQLRTKALAAIGAAVPEASVSGTASPYALGLTITSLVNGAVGAGPSAPLMHGPFAVTRETTGSVSAISAAADTITIASHGYSTAQAVQISSNGTLPGGLSAGTYYAIVTDSNTIKLATSVANANAGTAVNIFNAGSGTMTLINASSGTTTTAYISNIDISTQTAARNALSTLDTYMQNIANTTASIGAAQSRLATALASVTSARLNTQAAAARIMDTDMAWESAEYIRKSILEKSAASVLSQATRSTQINLDLLS